MGEYGFRLACLSLAVFFVVQLAAGAVVRAAAYWIAAAAWKMRPRHAARILLILRWTPAALGLFVVATVCIPSYLRFEPGETGEELGLIALAGAILALGTWGTAIFSGWRKVLRSRRCVRDLAQAGTPVVALAGIWRTRLLISPVVLKTLSVEQLDAAVRHERAHGAAHDNLKRTLLAFTPGLLPGVSGFAAIEEQWARLTEWAADDEAVAGDADRALALASALVSVARLGSAPVPLASSMLDGDDLTQRVERLLRPVTPQSPGMGPALASAIALAPLAALAGIVLRPATLESAHQLLEQFVK